MRWPRLTIRRIMGIVLALAVGLGLAVPAAQVWADRDGHDHRRQTRMNGIAVPGWPGGTIKIASSYPLTVSQRVESPFWPRYWRRLVGLSWRQVPACDMSQAEPGETCDRDPPKPARPPADAVARPTAPPPTEVP